MMYGFPTQTQRYGVYVFVYKCTHTHINSFYNKKLYVWNTGCEWIEKQTQKLTIALNVFDWNSNLCKAFINGIYFRTNYHKNNTVE